MLKDRARSVDGARPPSGRGRAPTASAGAPVPRATRRPARAADLGGDRRGPDRLPLPDRVARATPPTRSRAWPAIRGVGLVTPAALRCAAEGGEGGVRDGSSAGITRTLAAAPSPERGSP